MKTTKMLCLAVGLTFALTACGGGGGGNSSNSSDNGGSAAGSGANNGAKAIFEQSCSQCHGENLQGKIGPNLQHIGSEMSKQEILDQIKNGGGGMPPHVIKGQKAEKVATWLASKK
ncbi:MAG TPA: cytochrome c [Bacillales bacterium]|nr:cytochrome c [Bacillales bacterium]